jgi:hypothetical protein
MFAFELGARGQMVGCVLGSEDKRLSGISKREESYSLLVGHSVLPMSAPSLA